MLRENAGFLDLQAIDLQADFQYTASTFEIARHPVLCRLIAQNDLSSLVMKNDLHSLLSYLMKAASVSSIAAVAFLEALPGNFRMGDDGSTLLQLCQVYESALGFVSLDIHVAALQGLCLVLDSGFNFSRYSFGNYKNVIDTVLRSTDKPFPASSPALTTARLHVNGWVALLKILHRMANTRRAFGQALVLTRDFQSWSIECILHGKNEVVSL